MDAKNFGAVSLLAVLVAGVLLISGCAQNAQEQASGTTLKAEEKTSATTLAANTAGSGAGNSWCPVNTKDMGGVTIKWTGIERHDVNDAPMDLCCRITESARTGEKTKRCSSEKGDRDYSITWLASKASDGEYVMYTEIYQQDGKMCTRAFDVHGKEEKVTCTVEP